jgi:hypothetical protein
VFGDQVHDEQVDEEDGAGEGDVVDVAEEVDVGVVVVEVGGGGVVELQR